MHAVEAATSSGVSGPQDGSRSVSTASVVPGEVETASPSSAVA